VLERHGGPFIAPQENLAVRVSETRTCPGRGPDISGHRLWNPAAKPDNAERPDMSGLGLWNPAAKPDKVERSDMSGLGLWNPVTGSDMSDLT
jgi:hypothetical protein